MLRGLLQGEGHQVGRRHVSTLMKKIAIAALYRCPNTSKPAPGHRRLRPAHRRLAGVAHRRSELRARRALEQALHARGPSKDGGLVHHGDRGSRRLSIRYTERLGEAGIAPSVGSVGDSYDCESVWAA
jgi:transposase InsO family protein